MDVALDCFPIAKVNAHRQRILIPVPAYFVDGPAHVPGDAIKAVNNIRWLVFHGTYFIIGGLIIQMKRTILACFKLAFVTYLAVACWIAVVLIYDAITH